LDKDIHWGTDEENHKGGDYFKAKDCPRPWGKEDRKHATKPVGLE
jgi:hypothetical protein